VFGSLWQQSGEQKLLPEQTALQLPTETQLQFPALNSKSQTKMTSKYGKDN